nr:RHS repeat-associated core domain-containing protein [Vibrio cidicii]
MGFTGHEMLDDMGLIHMNGRVYDPTLARFLSADPYIQDKWFGTQAFNRYSYVQNNPLSYVDPTGLYSQAPNGMGTSSDAARAQARASYAQAMANTGAIAFGGYASLAKSQSAVANEGRLATTLQHFTVGEGGPLVSLVANKDGKTTIQRTDSHGNIVGTLTLNKNVTLKNDGFRNQLLDLSEFADGANIVVLSGFRDQSKQNSLIASGNIRAAKLSQHTVGLAADLRISGMTAKQASITAFKSRIFNRVNLYTSSDSIHVDQRAGFSGYYGVDWVKQNHE